jgi:hypothetical protein
MTPQRPAISFVTGRMRPSNHSSTFRFKPGVALRIGRGDKTPPQFANRDDAQKKRVVGLPCDPVRNAGFGPKADCFRWNVGVEKESAHRPSGRAVDGLRLKSISSRKELMGMTGRLLADF